MASLAISNTFTAGTTIVASQVNTNFSDIVNYINARNSGGTKWEGLTTSGNLSVDGNAAITGTISTGNFTTVIPGILGTVSAPMYSFSSDSDTGIYRYSTNIVGITSGGTLTGTFGTSSIYLGAPIQGQDGSAGSPAFSFNSDIDTGVYRIGSNNLGLATGGVKAIDISSSQVVTLTHALAVASGGTGRSTKLFTYVEYTGDGNATQDVAHGFDAKPDVVVVVRNDGTNEDMALSLVTFTSNRSRTFDGVVSTNYIRSYDSTNVTVGSSINSNGISYVLLLFKAQ